MFLVKLFISVGEEVLIELTDTITDDKLVIWLFQVIQIVSPIIFYMIDNVILVLFMVVGLRVYEGCEHIKHSILIVH